MSRMGVVLLEGYAGTAEEANKAAQRYQNCPYVAFLATTKNRVDIVYFLPEEQRWWVEEIEKEPRHMGFEKVKLFFPEKMHYPTEMKLHLPPEKTSTFSCGPHPAIEDCSKCPGLQRCLGCPGTIYYKE